MLKESQQSLELDNKIHNCNKVIIINVQHLIKITRHDKKQEYITHNQEKTQSIEADTEMPEMIEA